MSSLPYGPLWACCLTFLADAVSYLMSIGSLLLIRTPLQGERASGPAHLWEEVVDGLNWTWERLTVLLFGIAAAINDMVGAGLSLTIIVVARHAGASAPAIGLMFAIAAVGGTAGSFLTGPLMARLSLQALMIGLVCGEVMLGPLFLLTVSPIVLGVLTGPVWLLPGVLLTILGARPLIILLFASLGLLAVLLVTKLKPTASGGVG